MTFDYEFLDDTYAHWQDILGDSEETLPTAISYGMKPTVEKRSFDEHGNLMKDARPYETDSNAVTKNHPLNIMVMSEREHLLNHPLVISLLRHKWNSYGRYVYYSALLIYIIYLFFLTGYIVVTDPPQVLIPKNFSNYSSFWTHLQFDNLCQKSSIRQKPFATVAKYVIMVLTIFHVTKELFQLMQRRWNYLTWENVIEWFVYISSFILVLDFSDCIRRTGIRYPWQWQIGAAAIFLAWMNLVLFIRKFPRFGIYVLMFTDILRTFSRFFVVFLLFIVAFALGFYTLFQNQHPFRDVPHSLIKTVVMMIGEFEFDDIFNELNPDNDQEQEVFYAAAGYALFCAFIILMTLLIMNLLDEIEHIKQVQESMSTRVDQMNKRVENMETQQQRLHSMMEAVLGHFSVPWEDQDEFKS